MVAIYGSNHPLTTMTTYTNAQLLHGLLTNNVDAEGVVVGHDVWIGHGAVILPGVHIGNGAVIGANAVVTKNVAPYAIVVGSPARLLRLRIAPQVGAVLEASKWWLRAPEQLEDSVDAFSMDLSSGDADLELLKRALYPHGTRNKNDPSEQKSMRT